MSYIHCSNDNYYKPSESLKNLFEELVIQPFKRYLPILAEDLEERRFGKLNYQRKVMLEQGRTNFDEPFEGFSPEGKVSFYSLNYMPMHLYSSYHIFTKKLFLPVSGKVVFIDFGCGPLTSGIAFWAAARQGNITYVGIDSSQTMRNMARRINQYGPNGSGEPFYKDFHIGRDYNGLPKFLSDEIKLDNPADTLVIFNFCYFLQSKTFEDPSKIEELGELLYFADIGTKICMVYQDPVGDRFQGRWHNFKSWVITYHSAYDVSGFGWQDPTKVASVKYDTLWGEQHAIKVSHDSFNNFYYYDHYRDR